MGDLPSSSEPSLNQCLLLLERRLKEQHDSHQQQLASFLAVNASLREENAATALTHLDTAPTTHRLNVPTTQRSPALSESTNNFSPSPRHPRRYGGLPRANRSPSPQRNLDPALRALYDISSPPFVPAILNQEAPPYFSLTKFQMYNGLQDSFGHLMHYWQIMTLQTRNGALLCKVFSSSLAGLTLSWFHRSIVWP